MCGTSTGALLSGLLFVKKNGLAETEKIYRELSTEVFKMNNLLGISQLFLNHAFYDCKLLERIVRCVHLGVRVMVCMVSYWKYDFGKLKKKTNLAIDFSAGNSD